MVCQHLSEGFLSINLYLFNYDGLVAPYIAPFYATYMYTTNAPLLCQPGRQCSPCWFPGTRIDNEQRANTRTKKDLHADSLSDQVRSELSDNERPSLFNTNWLRIWRAASSAFDFRRQQSAQWVGPPAPVSENIYVALAPSLNFWLYKLHNRPILVWYLLSHFFHSRRSRHVRLFMASSNASLFGRFSGMAHQSHWLWPLTKLNSTGKSRGTIVTGRALKIVGPRFVTLCSAHEGKRHFLSL